MHKGIIRTIIGFVLAAFFIAVFGDKLACAANAQTLELDYAKHLTSIEFVTPAEAEAQLAVETEEERFVSFTLTTTIFDKYLGANGDVFHDAAVVQGSLPIQFRNGVYFVPWFSWANDGYFGSGFGDEVDGTVGFFRGNWDFSAAYFWIAPSAGSDVLQLQVVYKPWSFERGANSFVLDTKAEYYLPASSGGPAEGTILRVGLSHTRQLGERWLLSQRGGVFYDTGAFGYQRSILAEWNGSLMVEWKGVSVGPVVKFATPLALNHNPEFAPRSTQWAVGLTVTKNF